MTLDEEDVTAIAAAVVRMLHGGSARQPAEPLLTKADLAVHLRVKEAQIDRFVRRGMPKEIVGASPRFRLAACSEWIRQNARTRPATRPEPRTSAADGPIPGVTPLGRARRVG